MTLNLFDIIYMMDNISNMNPGAQLVLSQHFFSDNDLAPHRGQAINISESIAPNLLTYMRLSTTTPG